MSLVGPRDYDMREKVHDLFSFLLQVHLPPSLQEPPQWARRSSWTTWNDCGKSEHFGRSRALQPHQTTQRWSTQGWLFMFYFIFFLPVVEKRPPTKPSTNPLSYRNSFLYIWCSPHQINIVVIHTPVHCYFFLSLVHEFSLCIQVVSYTTNIDIFCTFIAVYLSGA